MEKVNYKLNNAKLSKEWCKHYRRDLHKETSKKRRKFLLKEQVRMLNVA